MRTLVVYHGRNMASTSTQPPHMYAVYANDTLIIRSLCRWDELENVVNTYHRYHGVAYDFRDLRIVCEEMTVQRPIGKK